MIAVIVQVIYEHAQWIPGKAVLHKTLGNRLKTFLGMPLLSKLMCLWALRESVLREFLPQAVITADVSISHNSNQGGKGTSTTLEKPSHLATAHPRQRLQLFSCVFVTSFLEIPFYFQHGKNFKRTIFVLLQFDQDSPHFSNYHVVNSMQIHSYTEISQFRHLKFSQIKSPHLNLLMLCVVESSSDLWDVWKQYSQMIFKASSNPSYPVIL